MHRPSNAPGRRTRRGRTGRRGSHEANYSRRVGCAWTRCPRGGRHLSQPPRRAPGSRGNPAAVGPDNLCWRGWRPCKQARSLICARLSATLPFSPSETRQGWMSCGSVTGPPSKPPGTLCPGPRVGCRTAPAVADALGLGNGCVRQVMSIVWVWLGDMPASGTLRLRPSRSRSPSNAGSGPSSSKTCFAARMC